MASTLLSLFINGLDAGQLEEWVLAFVDETRPIELPARRIGVSGQVQKGVDVVAVVRGVGLVGYQAKAYVKTKLTKIRFDKELKEAHTFQPPLSYYAIVTLNSRSAELQEHVRHATLHGKPNCVEILALEDLAEITDRYSVLKQRVFQLALSQHDSVDLLPVFHALQPLQQPTTLPREIDSALPVELRNAEEWINNGMPRKALAILDAFNGTSSPSNVTRIRCRALYSLDDYQGVLSEVARESQIVKPNGAVLVLGALAANALNDVDHALRLLDEAVSNINESSQVDVIAGYVRLKARIPGTSQDELERFASDQLGSGERVAAALADSAAALGERARAAYWFKVARETRPSLGLAVQLNEVANALVLAHEENDPSSEEISVLIAKLEQLETEARDTEAPSVHLAALINLGVAYAAAGREGDAAVSWDEALAAPDNQEGLWIRRCLLSANEAIPPPSQELIERHARNAVARLVLASAFSATGRAAEAIPLIESVLRDPEVSPQDIAIAHVERLKVRAQSTDLSEVIADGLTTFESHSELPLLGWLALNYQHASFEQQTAIEHHVSILDQTALDDDEVLGIATAVRQSDFITSISGWAERFRRLALDGTGTIRDQHAAHLYADLQASTLDFSGAVETRSLLVAAHPDHSGYLLRYAQVLFDSGDREAAFEAMDAGLSRGVRSSLLIKNWAMFACALGRKRKAKEKFAGISPPVMTTAKDFLHLMQARALLGIEGEDADVLEALRRGLLTPENASSTFAINMHRRRRNCTVQYGSIVGLKIPGAVDESCLLLETAAPAPPGIRSYDAASHPWVRELIGAQAGDEVILSAAPFNGTTATIVSISAPTDFAVQEAVKQIGVSPPETTGVRTITGTIEEQLEDAKKLLMQRHDSLAKRIQAVKKGRFPIALVAEQFGTSPRELIVAHDEWQPQAHPGSAEAIQSDDEILARSTGWILDPVTVLLIATIGAGSLLSRLSRRPCITKQAAGQLFDWYMLEREGRRAVGHMNLTPDGQLVMTEYGLPNRVAMLSFWRSVRSIVQNHCDVIEIPTVAPDATTLKAIKSLGMVTLSTFHAAKFHGYTLISEEENVRLFATHTVGASAASLQRLIMHALKRNLVGLPDATKWLSTLIRMGWTWVTFETPMLESSLKLDEQQRWVALEAFLSRLPTAHPARAIPAIFDLLRSLDAGRISNIDVQRLRTALVSALPKVDYKLRKNAVKKYRRAGTNADHRLTVRELSKWVELS